MSSDHSLERWYRLLLLAYPRRHRREHATAMLGTLLDAAAAEQHRPTMREAIDLLRHGLICRFTVPRGPGYLTVATAVAVFCAIPVATGAAVVAWHAAAHPPRVDGALDAARETLDVGPLTAPRIRDRRALLVGSGNPPAEAFPGANAVALSLPIPARGYAAAIEEARARLGTQGWRVTQTSDATFWATRSDLVLHVSAGGGSSGVAPRWLDVHRRAPGWINPAVVVATLVGLAGGWLLAGWALRRFQRHGFRGQAAMIALAGIAGLPLTVLGVGGVLIVGGPDSAGATDPRYLSLALASQVNALAFFLGSAALGLLGAGGVAALPATARTPQPVEPVRVWRYLAGGTATAHFAVLITTLGMVAVYAALTLSRGTPPSSSTMDRIQMAVAGSAAVLQWLYDLVWVIGMSGSLVGPLLLVASVPLLIRGRRLPPEQTRAAWWFLLAAAASAVCLPLITFYLPTADQALHWWMD